jgi:hypothetical protein
MPVITIIFWNSAGYCPCCNLFYHQFLHFAMAPNHDWRPCNSMHQLHQLLIPMAPPPEMLGWGIDLYIIQRFKHCRYLSCTVGENANIYRHVSNLYKDVWHIHLYSFCFIPTRIHHGSLYPYLGKWEIYITPMWHAQNRGDFQPIPIPSQESIPSPKTARKCR